MKVISKYNQMRRDCNVDLECEDCGELRTITNAYDDRNYWDNVIPSYKCKKCGKSTNDLGLKPEFTQTRYGDYENV